MEGKNTMKKFSLFTLMQRGFSVLTVASLSTLLIVTTGTTAHAEDEIRFGASLSLTGSRATEGRLVKDGYDFMVKHINEKGASRLETITIKSLLSTTTTKVMPIPEFVWLKN